MDYKHFDDRTIRHLLSAPFIYVLFFPFALLDIMVEIYHQVCFRLYCLPIVHRSEHIRIDRQKLSYLNNIEKINCMYCGYVNGLISYHREIAAHTEKYWCGIKHGKGGDFKEPEHHKKFLDFGDEKGFNMRYRK